MRNIGQHILANFNKTSQASQNLAKHGFAYLAYLVLHCQHILATLRDTSRNIVLHLSAYFTLREYLTVKQTSQEPSRARPRDVSRNRYELHENVREQSRDPRENRY